VSYDVEATPRFLRKSAKFLRKHPERRADLEAALDGLSQNPFQPALRLHPLAGRLQGLHAVSLTFEFRIVLVLRAEERRITLINIGAYDEVYGN
jgi:mRNA-degrading endonuclease YafQ of YafQ-DinJ toxin-antitoxin module